METRLTDLANLVIAVLFLAGCAPPPGGRPAAAAPRKYEGTCVLAGIEQVPAPLGQREDSVVLVARYRPSGAAHAGAGPWSLRFQVERAREHDLRLHIESHPTVLCDVDRAATAASPAHIDVPPFSGQRGTVDR